MAQSANPHTPRLKSLLETISFLANHANAVSANEAGPPFAYASLPADAGTQTYPMTPGNAAPALVVWLYLVTENTFLDELEKVGDPNGDFNEDNLPFTDIVNHTNLKPETVRSILACYINDTPGNKAAWRHVADQFQAFAQANTTNAIWRPDNCPGRGILTLAVNGAAVIPNSQVPPLP